MTPKKGVLLLVSAMAVILVASSVIGRFTNKASDDVPETENVRILDDNSVQASKVSYTGESGVTYTLGCDELVEIEGGIALPLSPTSDATDKKIGYQLSASEGALEFADGNNLRYVNATDPFVQSFCIDDWSRLTLFDGGFRSAKRYGVALVINNKVMERIQNGETDDRVLVRTIELENQTFLDAFYIRVGINDDNKCYLLDAVNADISQGDYASYREEACKIAMDSLNEDGWSVSSYTKADGNVNYSLDQRYPTLPAASRYVVEEINNTYSTFMLNRGEQGKATTATVVDADLYPIFAVTPCYDAKTAAEYGLYTIYLYPAFIHGGETDFSYIGYTVWSDDRCIIGATT